MARASPRCYSALMPASRLVPSVDTPPVLIWPEFDSGAGQRALRNAARDCSHAVGRAGWPFNPEKPYGCGAQGCVYPGTGHYRGKKYAVKFTVSRPEAVAAARFRDLAKPSLFDLGPPFPRLIAQHYAAFTAPCSDLIEASVRTQTGSRRRAVFVPAHVVVREDVAVPFDVIVGGAFERGQAVAALAYIVDRICHPYMDARDRRAALETFNTIHNSAWAPVAGYFTPRGVPVAAMIRELGEWVIATGVRLADLDHNVGLREDGTPVIYDVGFAFMPGEAAAHARKTIKPLHGVWR